MQLGLAVAKKYSEQLVNMRARLWRRVVQRARNIYFEREPRTEIFVRRSKQIAERITDRNITIDGRRDYFRVEEQRSELTFE